MRYLLHHLLTTAASRWGDRRALTRGDASWTYSELLSQSRRMARELAGLGGRRHDRVAIYLDKRMENVATVFACSMIGATFVPVNPLLKPHQVSHILADSGARFLVTTRNRFDLLGPDHLAEVEHTLALSDDGADSVPHSATPADTPSEPNGVDTDPAAIFYTSGSTGRPKGVVLSHRNLLVGAKSVSTYLDNSHEDVLLAVLPLSFDAGFSQLTTAFAVGAEVVLLDYLLAGDVVRSCARHGVTGITAVPPLWAQLAEQDWPPEATGRIRYFANTGGRMPKVTLERLLEIFPGARPYLMYGLTEAFRSTYLDPDEVDRRPESIGKAIPNAEILVVDADGHPIEVGEGELVHRGATVALGYWNDPERTAARFRAVPGSRAEVAGDELAVWSGDIVRRDEEGFLYFVGRNDEMIKTSGYRVSPTEIEEAAHQTGLVQDATAFGVEDERLGQSITLVVTPATSEATASDLTAALRRLLPLYMVPREIVLRDAALPRSPNGKIDRTRVRESLDD